jgi:hypothetical protein
MLFYVYLKYLSEKILFRTRGLVETETDILIAVHFLRKLYNLRDNCTQECCCEYSLDMFYAEINHGLQNSIAVKKQSNKHLLNLGYIKIIFVLFASCIDFMQ